VAIHDAGYGAVWQGLATWNGVAILARKAEPVLTRRRLPGDPSDAQSRYIETAVEGVLVGCLYLLNSNPWPGPKFAYKLAWFERLIAHAAEMQATGLPVVLANDCNGQRCGGRQNGYPLAQYRRRLGQPGKTTLGHAGRDLPSFARRITERPRSRVPR
jgi:hypothetical protein